jgi:hypothetical protein
MTREEFIKVLQKERVSYKTVDDKMIVDEGGFYHQGKVILNSLTSLPSGVKFKNREGVYLDSLTSIPPGVEFNNGGSVNLRSISSISPGVEFTNKYNVYLGTLSFGKWEGNIEGINYKRLLNKMISLGLFER